MIFIDDAQKTYDTKRAELLEETFILPGVGLGKLYKQGEDMFICFSMTMNDTGNLINCNAIYVAYCGSDLYKIINKRINKT